MFRILRLSRAACLSGLILVATGVFAGDVLDRSLDGDGIRVIDAGSIERIIAHCPAADGKQLVVMRLAGAQIATARLLWDGRIDPAFGEFKRYGVSTFATDVNGVALCRPDGSIWLAAQREVAGGDQNVLLMGIAADGGLLPGFAGVPQGVAQLDLDSVRGDLLDREEPLGFNHRPDGGALLTGVVDTATGARPFLATFTPAGLISQVAFPMPAGFSGDIHATAAAVGPGGGIWVVGDGVANGRRAYRLFLDPQSLAVVRTEAGGATDVRTVGGGMIREGVMVVGATQRGGAGPAQPRLLVFRAGDTGFSMLPLPAAAPLAPGLGTGLNAAGCSVLPLPGNRVLYAIGAEAFEGTTFRGYKGWYFARAFIGDSAAEDRIDTRFGDGGQSVLSVRSHDASCAGKLNTQFHARVGHWLGRPTIAGTMKRRCDPDGENDAVLLRLKSTDAMFDDGFE